MLVFAGVEDVEKWAGEPLPEGTPVMKLLRAASIRVRHAIRFARFQTTPFGLPSDPDVSGALRDATCEQVSFWIENGIDPGKIDTDPRLQSTGLDGATFSYDVASAAATVEQARQNLADDAVMILHDAGLTRGEIWAP